MGAKLNVLVLEDAPGAARQAREELLAGGHHVYACHEPGAPAFPCNAIADGRRCPLDSEVIDVALVVRAHNASVPAPREDGAACAIRRKVPLVVAGETTLHPYGDYAADVVDGTLGLVAACERTAAAPMPLHTAAAARALRETFDRRGITGSPQVVVHRREGALLVHVTDAPGLDAPTRGMATVRMMAALRELDRDARGIDVVFGSDAPA